MWRSLRTTTKLPHGPMCEEGSCLVEGLVASSLFWPECGLSDVVRASPLSPSSRTHHSLCLRSQLRLNWLRPSFATSVRTNSITGVNGVSQLGETLHCMCRTLNICGRHATLEYGAENEHLMCATASQALKRCWSFVRVL